MSVILYTFTACGTSGKEGLQEPVTDTAGLSDAESVQIGITDSQEGELM